MSKEKKDKKTIDLKNNKVMNFILENKKHLLIGGGIILGAILLVVLILTLSGRNDNKVLEGIFASDKPIVISKDGKYGYITKDGKELIEPKYTEAGEFYFDYALVSTMNDENRAVYQIIDKKGVTMMEVDNSYRPEYIEETAVWLIDNKIYDKDMKLIFEDESYITPIDYGYFTYMSNDGKESGILNSDGEKVFSWNEDYITADISSSAHAEEGYYAAVSNYEESELVVNLNSGKTIYTLKDPKNQYIQVEDNNVFRVIDRSDSYKTVKWMYFKDSELVFEKDESIYAVDLVDYDNQILRFNYGEEYENENKDSRYEYYDIKGSKILDKEPEKISKINEITEYIKAKYGYKIASCDDGMKKIDLEDESITACEYTSIQFLNSELFDYILNEKDEAYVLLETEETTILYDLEGKKEIKTFDSTSVTDKDRSTFLTGTLYEENGYTKKGFIIYNVLTGKELEFDKNADIELKSNYIKVTVDEKTTYYNTKLESIYEE